MKRRAALLRTMARIRHLAVEAARRELEDSLAAERAAQARAGQAARDLAREQGIAAAPGIPHAAGAAFAIWLPAGQAALRAAGDAQREAEAASDESGRRVAAARAAEESVQRRLDDIAGAARAEAIRKEQLELDEIARRRLPGLSGGSSGGSSA